MNTTHPIFFFFTFFLFFSSSSSSPCNTNDSYLLSQAFSSVSGFSPSLLHATISFNSSCSSPPISHLLLPNSNLHGSISWLFFRNISNLQSIDLSSNSLTGSIPPWFFSLPNLISVNLSYNLFTSSYSSSVSSSVKFLDLSHTFFSSSLPHFNDIRLLRLSHVPLPFPPPPLHTYTMLEYLDLSCCRLSGELKPISKLHFLKHLDLSNNSLQGTYPLDFPPIISLNFLNISLNHFAGVIAPASLNKFGRSAFIHAGDFAYSEKMENRVRNQYHVGRRNCAVVASGFLVLLMASSACFYMRKKKRKKEKQKNSIVKNPFSLTFMPSRSKSGHAVIETESLPSWVGDIKDPALSSSPVVMFEKPLLNLTFIDLISATSRFGRESMLAEGRRGPVYRAVLPGDIHVAIKVLEQARDLENEESITIFEDLYKLNHPNLLPLTGYCIAGKEKLVLHEFMENGDLRRWLNELPEGEVNVEEWKMEAWEEQNPEQGKAMWETRHGIAVGIARGVAFLHHAGSKQVVHGHLVASNVLLTDHTEPRVVGFGFGGGGSPEDDVYSFGVILMELVTGKTGEEEEMVKMVRKAVRERRGGDAVDVRLRGKIGEETAAEMAEALQVGCMCTVETKGKRPSMWQVLGLLKDVRKSSDGGVNGVSSSTPQRNCV